MIARAQSIGLKVAVVTAVAQALAAIALKESYATTVIGAPRQGPGESGQRRSTGQPARSIGHGIGSY